ncbi:hypothetical protein [uncultured Fibrobacter sp.]|uniref:hypothetical protein n=1 Tax=uncultured Fibrobacter sp. TaxID=261512 RepID=UPI00260C412B|nr:hypothetical protein [uncultured Fibrobacter sp.]
MLQIEKFFACSVICALSSTMFIACGNDSASSSADDPALSSSSASSSSGEDTRSVIDSLMDVYSITVEDDKLVMSFDDTVDKKKQVISFKEKVMPSWMCLVENEKFQWGIVDESFKMDPYKYLFVGDSLVLFYGRSGESFESSGLMYVGGSAGKIEGTWTPTSCTYREYEKETVCRDGDSRIGIDIRIAKNTFSFMAPGGVPNVLDSSDVLELKRVNLRYGKNGVRTYLYKSLYTGKVVEFYAASEIVSPYITDDQRAIPEYTDELLEALGIESLSITDTGETFKIGGKTYSVEITRAEYLDGGDYESSLFAELQVTSDSTTCTYYDERTKEIPKFLCSEENAKYIKDLTDSVDASGNAFTLAHNYEKNNKTKFFACLKKILPEPTGTAKKFDKLTEFDL